jgi:hypothetical protein
MKLKTQSIKCKNLLRVVDRFINLNSSYKYLSRKFKINIEYLNQMLEIPIVIFLRSGTAFINKTSIDEDGIENLVTSITLDIHGILNIQQLIVIKISHDLFYQKEIENRMLNVIFIEINKEINYQLNEKLSLFLDIFSCTKKDTKSIDTNMLEKIFTDEDKKIFHNKFDKSISKHFFPQQRKAEIVKQDVVKNPWLNLYIQHNKNYLSMAKASKNSKEIKIIHCPICAKEHQLSDDLIQIIDDQISFVCEHKGTQFLKYRNFFIPRSSFKYEDFNDVNIHILQRFFKHNIQPIIINNVYFVAVITDMKIEYLPLKRYMKFPQKKVEKVDEHKSTLITYHCPICANEHRICFSYANEDYIDIAGNIYLNYSKLFQIKDTEVEFMCEHKNTLYENYKYLSKKNTKKDLMNQALDMTNSFFGNYLDGKKIVYMLTDTKPYLIDMANFI